MTAATDSAADRRDSFERLAMPVASALYHG